jgi:hypothetical protein
LSNCGQASELDNNAENCSDKYAVKCVVISNIASPSNDYVLSTKIDSYGGGFGTGYDSADVYVRSTKNGQADTLLLSIEDNSDDISSKNIKAHWISEDKIEIRYGHGDINFQVVKFAGKDVLTYRDIELDAASH